MRYFIFIILICIPFTNIFSEELDKNFLDSCLYPTVLISISDGHGTGTIVRSELMEDNQYLNIVLTCNHILTEGLQHIKVPVYEDSKFNGFDVYHASIYNLDQKLDLAILFFRSSKKILCAKIGLNEKLSVGDSISGVGCGILKAPRFNSGYISFIGDNDIITSVFTVPGDSGGPIYKNNLLVGIKQSITSFPSRGQLILTPNVSKIIPVYSLLTWNIEIKNAIEFVLDESKPIPEWLIIYSRLANMKLL